MAINQLISYTAKNVGTTAATVFTAQAAVQTTIQSLTLSNTSALPVTASIIITRGGVDVYVVKNATVNPGGTLVAAGVDQKICLIAGDQLKAVSSVTNSLDVVASALLTGEVAASAQPVNIGPVPVVSNKTFNLNVQAPDYTGWWEANDIGTTLTLASGTLTSGSDAGGAYKTASTTTPAAVTGSVTAPTNAYTIMMKVRPIGPTTGWYQPLVTRYNGATAYESIAVSGTYGRPDISYTSANGTGSVISTDEALKNSPLLVIVLRQSDTIPQVYLDVYNITTRTLVYRNDTVWRTGTASATSIRFGLGTSTTPHYYYESASFSRYLSNTELNAIYAGL